MNEYQPCAALIETVEKTHGIRFAGDRLWVYIPLEESPQFNAKNPAPYWKFPCVHGRIPDPAYEAPLAPDDPRISEVMFQGYGMEYLAGDGDKKRYLYFFGVCNRCCKILWWSEEMLRVENKEIDVGDDDGGAGVLLD